MDDATRQAIILGAKIGSVIGIAGIILLFLLEHGFI